MLMRKDRLRVINMLCNEKLDSRVMLELTEILMYCNTCEFQVLELLKVVNCIFSKEEFFELLDMNAKFKSNMEILGKLMSQVDRSITMLQLITVKSVVNELKENFDKIVEVLDKADKRIDGDEIDFGIAGILSYLLDIVEFDVVDYESFEDLQDARYFIATLMSDEGVLRDPRYGSLNVLVTKSFKKKRDAYIYALKNGISKDMIWSMY